MPDVIKGTLWLATDPSWGLVINNGDASIQTAGTAAGMHDGSDASVAQLACSASGGFDGDASMACQQALTPVPVGIGTVSFLRLRHRSRVVRTLGSGPAAGNVVLLLDYVELTVPDVLTSAFADYTQDVPGPWLPTAIDGHVWGLQLAGTTGPDPFHGTALTVDNAEFTIELWGPSEDDVVDLVHASGIPVKRQIVVPGVDITG